MSRSGAPPSPRSWAAPDCPDCETDVFVDSSKNSVGEFVCRFCGRRWSQ